MRLIPRLFFETKYFRDRYRDFFSRLNIFETDTETFFETKIFETETDTFKKYRKVSIPRSLETRCHTLPGSDVIVEEVYEHLRMGCDLQLVSAHMSNL